MKWLEILSKLEAKRCYLFSVEEFRALIGSSQLSAKRLLQRYAKRGLVNRLKKGWYLVPSHKPPDIFIANKLYQPSYVSFEYALAYYHLIPETVYELTSATIKSTRNFEAMGRNFSYAKIKTRVFNGYAPKTIDGYTVLLATPEKALADYLYFAVLKHAEINDRLDLTGIKAALLRKLIRLYKNKKLSLLTEEILCSQKK